MPDDKPEQPDKPPGKSVEGTVRIPLGITATATAQIRVRLIQHSPDADPKLVEEVRKFERELKEQGSEDSIDPDREAP